MIAATIYCQAVQRDVLVYRTDAALDDAQANVTGAETACAEVSASCSGDRCPLGHEEPSASVHRLLRHGLPTDRLKTFAGHCLECDLDTEFAMCGTFRGACLLCGSVRDWTPFEEEPHTH